MSRGGSYGGGQSSLGYLFGSEEPNKVAADHNTPVSPSPTKIMSPPYGTDIQVQEPGPDVVVSSSPIPKQHNNNYHRAQGQNSGNFITDRPSTKVISAPGGSSSLGYLFGDK
ncbi:unnamed protein product [Amaranthus hypochondriacus]